MDELKGWLTCLAVTLAVTLLVAVWVAIVPAY
jgi:hypothetical protein